MELGAGIRLEHVVHIGNTFWALEIANHLVQYHGQAYAIYHVLNSPLSAAILGSNCTIIYEIIDAAFGCADRMACSIHRGICSIHRGIHWYRGL